MVSQILTLSCPDKPGIVHAVTGLIAAHGGNIEESQQFGDNELARFFMRIQFGFIDDAASLAALREDVDALARDWQMTLSLTPADRPMRTVVMVSKESHCAGDLLYQQSIGRLPIEVVAMVGNHPDLAALAEFYGVPFHHVPVTPETKATAEAALEKIVDDAGAELIVLARYMQILSESLCERYSGRIINIHHSFLPSFKGARPYHQAHARGVKLIGATAHYVTADLDEGPIIEQDVLRVTHRHSPTECRMLGQDVERQVLARAVRWHAEHRVMLNGSRTVVFA